MSFTLVRGQEPFPKEVKKSIFLVGPIPRTVGTKPMSWKPEAYRILEELGYDGVVYDPEHELTADIRNVNYERGKQIDWEVEALSRADVIVAWIPRKFPEMPAMSSNIEMGELFKSGRMLLGYPEETPRMEYITYRSTDWLQQAYRWQVPVFSELRLMLQKALEWIGDGALRRGGEVSIPLNIWREKSFQNWYGGIILPGHKLEDLKVEYVYYRRQGKLGQPQIKVWAVRPKVRIADENRLKDNEVVIGRPPVVSVLMYHKSGSGVQDWEVILVKEYRPAVMNYKGMVYELPGGSIEPIEGPHDERAILSSALREVYEEVGLGLDASRLCQLDVLQTMSTMVACENHLYTYELNAAEFRELSKKIPIDVSQVEDNDEYTLPVVAKIHDLLSQHPGPQLDWVNMGMIMRFVALQKMYNAF